MSNVEEGGEGTTSFNKGASSFSHTERGAQKGSVFKKKGHQKVYTVLSGEGAGGLEVGII